MPKGLTEKEQEFLKIYFQTGSQKKAYMTVYPNKTELHAVSHASEFYKRIRKKLSREEIFEYANLGLGRVLSSVEELLNSTNPYFNKEGVHLGDYPDNKTRLGATTLLSKMIGADVKDQEQETEENKEGIQPIAINIGKREIEIIEELKGDSKE